MHTLRFLHHPLFLVFLFVGLLLHVLLVIAPSFMILRKMGYSGWWALVNYLPFGTVIGLWLLATAGWPVERRPAAASF